MYNNFAGPPQQLGTTSNSIVPQSSSSQQNLACQDCLSKVPGLDYIVPSNQSVMLRNYTPPEYPTVVYVPQRQCQPQYNNLVLPQYQCTDQQGTSSANNNRFSNVRSSTPGRKTETPQTIGPRTVNSHQQYSNTSNNNQSSGTYNYSSKKPCCYPENGTTNNVKYLQEVEGQEFVSHFPNKKYNRKKINLEANAKEHRPKMNSNKWATEHRENFGFFSCSIPNNEVSSIVSGGDSNSQLPQQFQQQLFVPPTTVSTTINQPQLINNPLGGVPSSMGVYNPDYYQQGMSTAPISTPATGIGAMGPRNDDCQDMVLESLEDTSGATIVPTKPSSSHKKKPSIKKEQSQKKEVTKVEPPQLSDGPQDRRSRGAYSDDNGGQPKDKKKTKQELYADVYNRTLSKIHQSETNQKKKLIDRQDQFYSRMAFDEKQTMDRNQRELQTYMNRGEKPPFFPYGQCNVTPVSDKSYMNTFNVAPRDSNQIVKDIVARREKTAEYDGWKKQLDEHDFKPWKPKSYYWKSFDRFDKYNNETRRERNSYGGAGNNELDDDSAPTPSNTTSAGRKKSSRARKEEKKTVFAEPIADSASDDEKENIRQQSANTELQQQNYDMKGRNSDYYSPEEYQMMIASQQQSYPQQPQQQSYQGQLPNNTYSTTATTGGAVNCGGGQYVYDQQAGQQQSTNMINCESKRPYYEGPLCSDLKGLQFAKFIPKDYSDFNPKNYKALPIHYLNYIRPAGKVTPSNDAISECFRFYD